MVEFRQQVGGETQNQEPFPLQEPGSEPVQELQHSEPRPRTCSSKKQGLSSANRELMVSSADPRSGGMINAVLKVQQQQTASSTS